MEDIDRERTFNTQVECPRCVADGITTKSGYASRIMYTPDSEPPFRCLAVHGRMSEEELVAAGVDRGFLRERTAAAYDDPDEGRTRGTRPEPGPHLGA